MSIQDVNDKIGAVAVEVNGKIENAVTGTYKKIEDSAVGAYKGIEDAFVGKFLKHDGETVEEAKARLEKKKDAL